VVKKKIIKNFEQLPEEIIEQVREMYPDGFEDNLITFENPKGEIELALPFETEKVYYLIKMPKSNTSEKNEEDEEEFDNTSMEEFDNFENLEIADDIAEEEE
jgi:CO dehydrogenase/acetyl-CoA synthase beta subunit